MMGFEPYVFSNLVTVAVLIGRLIIDWPKLRARLRRKGGG